MYLRKCAGIALFCGLLAPPLAAQELAWPAPPPPGWDLAALHRVTDSIVQRGLDSGAYPGCQVLMACRGQILLYKAYGYQGIDRLRRVSETDLYDLASLTKILGPLPLLMRLHGQGQLDLDAPLSRYLPESAGTRAGPLSLRSMLVHEAQLQAWIPFWQEALRKDGTWRRRFLRADSSARFPVRIGAQAFVRRGFGQRLLRRLLRAPRTGVQEYRYSDLGFIVYPHLIARLAGQPYWDLLRDSLYRPIGTGLTYNPLLQHPLSAVAPSEQDTFFRRGLIHGYVHDENAAIQGGVSGHAGLFGHARDVALLMQLFLNGGTLNGRRYLDSASVRLFASYQSQVPLGHRGLGFDKPVRDPADRNYCADSASAASFGHSGFTGTFTWADPETGLLIVFLSNRVHPSRASRQLYRMGIRPALHQALYALLPR
ncbi:MAG: serine hydrolase [Bacteroidia bacterium]|nr:serine hydrolase [Bacteroidia bacterium]